MAKPTTARKKRARVAKGGTMLVQRRSLYFASFGDPKGDVHVQQKWIEAELMSQLLFAAIAKSGIPINSLDLPGAARLMKEHVEANPNLLFPHYPTESFVHHAVEVIRQSREAIDEKHKKAVAAAQADQQTGHQPDQQPAAIH